DLVGFVEVHDTGALGVATDDADFAHVRPVHHALGGDQDDVLVVADRNDADDGAVAVGGADIANALAAAALLAVAHPGAILRAGFFFRGGFLCGGFGFDRLLG